MTEDHEPQPLENVFSQDAPEVEAQPETIGQPRDEQGRFAPQDAGETEPQAAEPVAEEGPPPSEPSEPGHVPIAALKDERAKRQQLEQQLAEYQAYIQQVQQQQFQPADPEVDPIAYLKEQVQAEVMPQVQQYALQFRVEMTEQLARQKWQDYDAKIELFKQEAASNPFLVEQVKQAPNPAEYAYNVASQIAVARQYGSEAPPSREELEAKIRAEIMAEIGMKPAQSAPTTLATQRSVGSRSGPAWSGPKAITDIF